VADQSGSLDQARWGRLWFRLGARADGEPVFQELAAAYGEAARAYHTTQHLRQCLIEFDRSRSLAQRPDEVEAALWFHDAVYVPGKTDNEERSAAMAETRLAAGGVSTEVARRIGALVLATRHAGPVEEPDARLVCDIDLAILGTEPAGFEAFERAIRREYRWVPDLLYRRARSAVLRDFLNRPSIYQTGAYVSQYEEPARRNLQRVLATLAG
jgi:predicted metal-dependent HD superfamily phosphohydrolase